MRGEGRHLQQIGQYVFGALKDISCCEIRKGPLQGEVRGFERKKTGYGNKNEVCLGWSRQQRNSASMGKVAHWGSREKWVINPSSLKG